MSRLTRRGLLLGAAALGLASGAAACSDQGATPPDRGKILADLSALVIVPAYTAAAAEARALEGALAALRDAPAPAALSAARDAWRKARRAWKLTDAFLFGPASDLSLTGGVLDTDADIAKVEALAAATAPLDAASVSALGANQRGLPGVEVLLFDPARDDAAMLAAFEAADRRRGLLAALLGADVRGKMEAVLAAWSGPPTDFARQLREAGRGSSVYAAERQGVDAVVNALVNAAEVLIAVRLAKPLGIDKNPPGAAAPELIESPRSDASVDDIVAVIDGIESVYFGRFGDASGLPLSAAVAERSPTADARMREVVPAARDAVRAVPGPLRTAVVERRDPVVAAHAAVREVKRCLATQVAGALGTSIGFNVTDGD